MDRDKEVVVNQIIKKSGGLLGNGLVVKKLADYILDREQELTDKVARLEEDKIKTLISISEINKAHSFEISRLEKENEDWKKGITFQGDRADKLQQSISEKNAEIKNADELIKSHEELGMAYNKRINYLKQQLEEKDKEITRLNKTIVDYYPATELDYIAKIKELEEENKRKDWVIETEVNESEYQKQENKKLKALLKDNGIKYGECDNK